MAFRVLLLAGGDLPLDGVAERLAAYADEVIAIDAGLEHAPHLGVEVNIVLGDLDSVPASALERHTCILLDDQDRTDLSKALTWCMQHRGAANIDVVGLDGGRLDHRLAVGAALIESESDAIVHLNAGSLRRCPPGKPLTVEVKPGTVLGLHPVGVVHGVRLRGATHELSDAMLTTGTRGVHNVATSTQVRLQVEKGDLLLSIER
jgi:thiamine pyrophosphokinase